MRFALSALLALLPFAQGPGSPQPNPDCNCAARAAAMPFELPTNFDHPGCEVPACESQFFFNVRDAWEDKCNADCANDALLEYWQKVCSRRLSICLNTPGCDRLACWKEYDACFGPHYNVWETIQGENLATYIEAYGNVCDGYWACLDLWCAP